QRDQRQKPLQAKRVEGAKTPAVQDDLDSTKKSDRQPRRGFATNPARVTRHMAVLVVVQGSITVCASVSVSYAKRVPGLDGTVSADVLDVSGYGTYQEDKPFKGGSNVREGAFC
ncbi:MAG: hypothetical protein ACREMX_09610, partial [Gemmatimonadales bacterium]